MQIFHQGRNKAPPELPNWRIVAPGGHNHKVTPPPLPSLILLNATMEVSAGVSVKLVPLDLLESEVLWGRGVSRKISLLPLPVL